MRKFGNLGGHASASEDGTHRSSSAALQVFRGHHLRMVIYRGTFGPP